MGDERRVRETDEIGRREFDLQAAFPALTNIVRCASADASTNVASSALLPEWADASEHVSGEPLRVSRLGHLRVLGARGARKRLQIERGRDRNDRDEVTAFARRDEQRLEHARRLDAERSRRLESVLGAPFVRGLVQRERDTGPLRSNRRRCPRRHASKLPSRVTTQRTPTTRRASASSREQMSDRGAGIPARSECDQNLRRGEAAHVSCAARAGARAAL